MQPTDYALGLLFAAWLDLAGWGLVIYGTAMVLGGLFAIGYLIVTWGGGVTLGPDPVLPPAQEPTDTLIHPAVRAEPNYHRSDDDTYVFARIPGATPEPTPPEQITDAELVRAIDGLRELPAGPELVRFLDAIDADVRVLEAAGPVCPICGGPWHALCPSAPTGVRDRKKAAEETQVVDLCPLTTQDLPKIPDVEPPLFAETFTRHPNAELGTQELSGSLARAKEQAA